MYPASVFVRALVKTLRTYLLCSFLSDLYIVTAWSSSGVCPRPSESGHASCGLLTIKGGGPPGSLSFHVTTILLCLHCLQLFHCSWQPFSSNVSAEGPPVNQLTSSTKQTSIWVKAVQRQTVLRAFVGSHSHMTVSAFWQEMLAV